MPENLYRFQQITGRFSSIFGVPLPHFIGDPGIVVIPAEENWIKLVSQIFAMRTKTVLGEVPLAHQKKRGWRINESGTFSFFERQTPETWTHSKELTYDAPST